MTAATTTTNAKPKSNRTNSIGGFFVNKVDGAVMRAYLKDAGVPQEECDPTIESDEALAVALTLYFRGKYTDENDLCKCEPCGGEGPAELPSCAFCGLVAPVDDDATNTEALAAKVEAEEAAKAPKKSSKKKITAPEKEATTETTETMQTQTNGSGKKSNGASTALATTKGSKEITAPDAQVVFTTADLDKSVERVVKLKSMAATSFWALGDELRKINEDKLWKLRLNAKGKAQYTSFDQFVENEAKIGHTYAYQLIDIATNFTESDVKQFGTTKLTLMLKVAPEDLPKVREIAATGVGRRALAVEVEKVIQERGHGSRKKNKKHSAAGKASGAKVKEKAKAKAEKAASKIVKTADKITVASIEGRKIVKLYAKPDSLRNIDWSKLKRAKTIDAQPFGRLELTNEVSIFLSVVKNEKTGELEIVANTRRDVSE